MAGFERVNESDLPFYSKDVSFERYGQWELDPSLQQKHFQYRGRSGYLEELANTVSFPDILSELDKDGMCMSMSEWLDAAEAVIQKEQGVSYDSVHFCCDMQSLNIHNINACICYIYPYIYRVTVI